MKVVIATGGTGGHINPALALAEALIKEDSSNEVIFFGSTNRMEANIIQEKGYPFYGTAMEGMKSGINAKVNSAISLYKARQYCKKLLKKEKPDICVGFGNYISVPLIKAAHRLGIPTMLHEQNSFAGKANIYLIRYADAIVTSYPNDTRFPSEKTRLLGNPAINSIKDTNFNKESLTKLGLDPEKPFIVFMMGSLGSETVSKTIDEACSLFNDDYQVVIASGKDNPYVFKTQLNDRIKIVEYVDGKEMLKGCALAITRAGATTISEITAIGVASIIIPSPYVANNHQYFNALELADNDATVLLEEKNLTPETLANQVNDLMSNKSRLEELRTNSRKLAKTNAARDMILWMKELTK